MNCILTYANLALLRRYGCAHPSSLFSSRSEIYGGLGVPTSRFRSPRRARRVFHPLVCSLTSAGREQVNVRRGDVGRVLDNMWGTVSWVKVAVWTGFTIVLWALRGFLGVVLGTFIIGYVANGVVRGVLRMARGKVPRRAVVLGFYMLIVCLIVGFSVGTVPTVIREGQYFVRTLQSENPYVFFADGIRKALGDDLAGKLEVFMAYAIEAPNFGQAGGIGRLGERVREKAVSTSTVWTAERSRRLGVLLQKSIRGYVVTTVSLVTKILAFSTKVVFKALLSLIFSFMIVWDLPIISKEVKGLAKSRFAPAYEEIAPVISNFGSVLGRSFEAQGAIALVNTVLTTAGLFVLKIPGIWFLSMVTLLCSFIPVAGVFISTIPMLVLALSEYGIAKAVGVVVMVALVHIVEAYVLNPQIYSAHLNLHPLLVLVVLYVAEHLYGIPGLLMAVPMSVYILRSVVFDSGVSATTEADNQVMASSMR